MTNLQAFLIGVAVTFVPFTITGAAIYWIGRFQERTRAWTDARALTTRTPGRAIDVQKVG